MSNELTTLTDMTRNELQLAPNILTDTASHELNKLTNMTHNELQLHSPK